MNVFEPYREIAQQIVSALVHGDRNAAADLATEAFAENSLIFPDVLVLVVADLLVMTHKSWAIAVHVDPVLAWQTLMVGVEEWKGAQ